MSLKTDSAWDPLEKDTIRRADHTHGLDFFRGKDYLGRHTFSFRIPQISGQLPKLPKLAEIEAGFEEVVPEGLQLKLILNDPSLSGTFSALCANLMESTRGMNREDASGALLFIVKRLVRWHQLLRPGRSQSLSEAQQIGLFGELLVLIEIVCPRTTFEHAAKSWRGPYGDEQDFSIDGSLIEVKTQRDSSDRRLIISSLDQLDIRSGNIFICHQTLTAGDDEDKGTSLRQLVDKVVGDAHEEGPIAADTLLAALSEYGYSDIDEYDSPYRALQIRTVYHVSENFPRITPDRVDTGIISAEYAISVEAAANFEIEPEAIWEAADNG